MNDKRIPCKSMFSNGTEYEFFLETQCFNGCTRFRKGQCRIYHRIEDARWVGKEVFPFDDLLDWEHYAGKACKSYTTKPLERKKPQHKVDKNQIEMEI